MKLDRLEYELDKHDPEGRLTPLAKAGVPIFHLLGDADEVKPLRLNSEELARRYRAAVGRIDLLVVTGKGHELAPEFWECLACLVPGARTRLRARCRRQVSSSGENRSWPH